MLPLELAYFTQIKSFFANGFLCFIFHLSRMGLVRITSWYPNFNGSHFGLPPSEIHRMAGPPHKIVWTMAYSHRPHLKMQSFKTDQKPTWWLFVMSPKEFSLGSWPQYGKEHYYSVPFHLYCDLQFPWEKTKYKCIFFNEKNTQNTHCHNGEQMQNENERGDHCKTPHCIM